MPGRALFAERATQDLVQTWLDHGARVKRTTLTEKYPFSEFLSRYGENAIVLFILNGGDKCRILTESPQAPQPGTTLISLVRDEDDSGAPEHRDAKD